MSNEDRELGAAVLAISAAIRLCQRHEIDPHDVVDLLLAEVFSPEGFAYHPPNERDNNGR